MNCFPLVPQINGLELGRLCHAMSTWKWKMAFNFFNSFSQSNFFGLKFTRWTLPQWYRMGSRSSPPWFLPGLLMWPFLISQLTFQPSKQPFHPSTWRPRRHRECRGASEGLTLCRPTQSGFLGNFFFGKGDFTNVTNLCLPEIVYHRQSHEKGVVSRPRNKCSYPHCHMQSPLKSLVQIMTNNFFAL